MSRLISLQIRQSIFACQVHCAAASECLTPRMGRVIDDHGWLGDGRIPLDASRDVAMALPALASGPIFVRNRRKG